MVETLIFLEGVSLDLITNNNSVFGASPTLRKYRVHANTYNHPQDVFEVGQVPNLKSEDAILRRVVGLLWMIQNKQVRNGFSLFFILDDLERLMQGKPRAKSFVSTQVATNVSQLSIFSEYLNYLSRLQPWARLIEHNISEWTWPDMRQSCDTGAR